MNEKILSQKTCLPCRGNTPPLSSGAVRMLLAQLNSGWQINDAGHLLKSYAFPDFMGAMRVANQIAVLAEQEAHHPDITIAWGKCEVEIWTHQIHGLSESDFILAAKIDALF